ncbi:unnamed protein product, partial [Sphacelaria rigidula]
MWRPNLGVVLGLFYWSTIPCSLDLYHHGVLGSRFAPQSSQKKDRFGLPSVWSSRCTCYWPTGPKGWSPGTTHSTRAPLLCAHTPQHTPRTWRMKHVVGRLRRRRPYTPHNP